MYFSSKFPTGRALTVALAMILWVFGAAAPQAKAEQQGCVTQTCPIDPHAQHEAEEKAQREADKQAREAAHAQHEAEEQQARDQKAAEHAQHEAAEACERNQKSLKHAQHEAEEARAKAETKEADVSKMEGKMCCAPSVAEVKSEPEVVMSKPTPPPEVETAPPSVIVITPVPSPAPEPEKPKELPRTAGAMELIGLIGLVSMSGSLAGFLRRK